MSETIIPSDIVDEMRDSYMEYAMSVIVGRALPDVRDGLKPVHRRVLFSMNEQGNDFNKPFRKSARVVGDVIGKYHPHGDSAVYDTIVRMTQAFSMRYQLVDGQGNFGSVDGDSPAAMRYTEVRMKRMAQDLMIDWTRTPLIFNRTMTIPRKSQLSCQHGCRICWPTVPPVLPSEWPATFLPII